MLRQAADSGRELVIKHGGVVEVDKQPLPGFSFKAVREPSVLPEGSGGISFPLDAKTPSVSTAFSVSDAAA